VFSLSLRCVESSAFTSTFTSVNNNDILRVASDLGEFLAVIFFKNSSTVFLEFTQRFHDSYLAILPRVFDVVFIKNTLRFS
jgi:hypothetical protein